MEMKFFFLYLSKIIGAQISAKAIKGLWKCYSSPRYVVRDMYDRVHPHNPLTVSSVQAQ